MGAAVNPWRKAWRALTCRRILIEWGQIWGLIGSRDDPFRAHYSVTVTRVSPDGDWIEYKYHSGAITSLRRDIFVSTYERACK